MSSTALILAIAVALGACSASSDPAHELATRLYPPCCQRQTLADHDSPAARAMRTEIAERLAAGETSAAIERSLVERYGERIVAVEPGHDRRGLIGGIAAGVIAAGLVALFVILRRNRTSDPVAPRRESDEDADRLDDELAAMTD
jgi:cytochrome c-type biogenesis protein CcmH/NrfF